MAPRDHASPSGPVDRRGHPLPEQATVGLLEYLGRHAVDDDYAFVSQRRAARAEPEGTASRRSIGPVGAAVLAVFAVLAVTAGVQTSRSAVGDQERRRQLVAQVDAARAQAREQRQELRSLQSETTRLREQGLVGDRSADDVVATVRTLGETTGTRAVRGEGVRITVDDAPGAQSVKQKVLDSDLQRLANGLWAAGAEAVALNGERLTNLTTIRLAGTAITVNNRGLKRPYVMTAIGDEDTLPARFAETTSGQAWLDLQRSVGLRLTITPVDSVRLPAREISTLKYANRPTGDRS